jgi:Na+/H+-translocating membrane pyrophosphatase
MAILFAMGVLLFLSTAFANPALLFPLFLIACIVIYSFASLNFLIKGIDGKKNLKKSSKDWIKVNAIVSIVFALLMIIECVVFLTASRNDAGRGQPDKAKCRQQF